MYPRIHTGEFPTVGVHTIYTHSGAFDVNSFWDTSMFVNQCCLVLLQVVSHTIQYLC